MEMDELQQEFHDFQLLGGTAIPKFSLNEKYPNMADRIDIVWNRIGIMTSADGMKRFKCLSPIAKLILSQCRGGTSFFIWLSRIKMLFVQILILRKP